MNCASGRELQRAEMFLNPDPTGTLVIETPESAIDPIATVIAIDFES
jgi:hypothetical protein